VKGLGGAVTERGYFESNLSKSYMLLYVLYGSKPFFSNQLIVLSIKYYPWNCKFLLSVRRNCKLRRAGFLKIIRLYKPHRSPSPTGEGWGGAVTERGYFESNLSKSYMHLYALYGSKPFFSKQLIVLSIKYYPWNCKFLLSVRRNCKLRRAGYS
jgi:hypothetical protein